MTFKIIDLSVRFLHTFNKRHLSTVTNASVRQFKNDLFDDEKRRQQSLITRVEKIEVKYRGLPNDVSLMMNKNMSTPYNCAMHIKEYLCTYSALAEVNGKLWDMHRPLTEDCELRLFSYLSGPPSLNKVFWRSCSFLLGMVVEKAFQEKYFVQLHSWPRPDIRSGSYVYDVDTGIPNWVATEDELKTFTTMMCNLSMEDHPFERLTVSKPLALEMFAHNRHKMNQIPKMSDEIVLYRVKDHIDISCGPMIPNTKFVGTTKITAVHWLDHECGYRFQGVSIPRHQTLNSYAFRVIAENGKKLNTTGLRSEEVVEEDSEHDEIAVADS